METLVEYLTYVKGIGYILVVAFLFAFITFWILVHTKNNEIVKNVPLVVMIWLVFGATSALVSNANNTSGHNQTSDELGANLQESVQKSVYAEFYGNGSPATIAAHNTEKRLKVNTTEYSSISYGSARDFHEIMSNKLNCKDCHHNSGNEIKPCKDCHNAPFDPKEIGKPGLKAAIHEKCIECHKKNFEGPEGCKLCHTKDVQASVKVVAPVMTHKLTWENCSQCHVNGVPGGGETNIVYHDFCLRCHTSSMSGATRMPDNHAGRAADTCKGCHKPAGGEQV
jgi:hypothetical protein